MSDLERKSVKARPILFSAPMIRALLAGTKTQTRRAVRPQPECGFIVGSPGSPACPYGLTGDLLYVKESWRTAKSLDDLDGTNIADKCLNAGYRKPWTPMQFEADGYRCSNWRGFGSGDEIATPGRYRHARFMPRWASRLTLRITDVRVQRLQEISNDDSIAEGIEDQRAPRMQYCKLWESINGAGSWAANPWVWAISFEVIQRNVDEVLRQVA